MKDPNNSSYYSRQPLPTIILSKAKASQENRIFSRYKPIPFSREGARKYISTPWVQRQCRGHIYCRIVCSCARTAALAIWGPRGMWEEEAMSLWRRPSWRRQEWDQERCITCGRI